ncbi:MAG: ABC transporter permease [Prolixibacteraceae bacterium]|nr:ABC transporter permease [Prolixibacteraceae bacterium]MBN2773827.1 ABC transporter permease [Prolixibacteraceae bacterium]
MKRLLIVRLIIESFNFAFNSLKVNRLRTFLSLLGITIGIFAIISVFTVIDSLEKFIRESLDSLGDNMVYIQKWPWTPPEGETEYPYWKYLNRPSPEVEENDLLLRRAKNVEHAVFLFGFGRTVQYENTKVDNAEILATTHALLDCWDLKMERGRYFTESEMTSGAPVAVLGSELTDDIFEGLNPVGRSIKLQGRKFRIIGVYEEKGQDLFGTSMDKRVHISVQNALTMVDIRNRDAGQTICIKAKRNVDSDKLNAELTGIMRSIRKLKPMEENDFAINEVSIISNQFDQFFSAFNMAGWIIGGFSILVGGFGIANIMFVSVKERTKIIGIQKSIGAKRYFILFEFIFEAIILSVIGGIFGLLLIFIGTQIFSQAASMTISLTIGNIVTGLMISSVIGFIAGLMPALSAARLDPVAAINSV